MPAVLFAESTDSRGRYNANEKEKETGKKRAKKKRKGEREEKDQEIVNGDFVWSEIQGAVESTAAVVDSIASC